MSENVNCHLIYISNFAEKLILHTSHLTNFTKNLGSNLIRVAKLLYNIGIKLLSQVYTKGSVIRINGGVVQLLNLGIALYRKIYWNY